MKNKSLRLRNKWNISISQEEMVKAKTDDVVMVEILDRINRYIFSIANKIYDAVKSDSSLDLQDIMSFCRMNVITSVRYYDPNKYDPKKDKGRYRLVNGKRKLFRNMNKDGFAYICNNTDKWMRYIMIHNSRKKRIPFDKIDSIYVPVLWNNEKVLLGDTIVLENGISHGSVNIIDIIKTYFSEHDKKIGNICLSSIVHDIIESLDGCAQLARKYRVSERSMREIIKMKIVDPLKRIKILNG